MFQTKLTEYKDIFTGMLTSKEDETNNALKHIDKRREEIEKLWGIIGKSAIVGNASYHANESKHFADIMMRWTIALMSIGLIVIGINLNKFVNEQWIRHDKGEINLEQLEAGINKYENQLFKPYNKFYYTF